MEAAGSGWRQGRDIDACNRTFLEFQRVARGEESPRQRAEARLVADERNPASACLLGQVIEDPGVGAARRQRVCGDDGRVRVETACNDFGCLFGADERAGEHHIEAHSNLDETGRNLPKAPDALVGQRPLPVIGPRFAAFGRNPVADEVQLRRHGHRAEVRRAPLRER